MLNCGVICDRPRAGLCARAGAADLATHPYLGRFIDTTTAAPCTNATTRAPMTRTESKQWKMELLRYMSETTAS